MRCPNCNKEFDRSRVTVKKGTIYCPHCGYKIEHKPLSSF